MKNKIKTKGENNWKNYLLRAEQFLETAQDSYIKGKKKHFLMLTDFYHGLKRNYPIKKIYP